MQFNTDINYFFHNFFLTYALIYLSDKKNLHVFWFLSIKLILKKYNFFLITFLTDLYI